MRSTNMHRRSMLVIALIGIICVAVIYIQAKPTNSLTSIDLEHLEKVSNPNGFEISKPNNWTSTVQGGSILVGQSFSRNSDYYSVDLGGDFAEKIEEGIPIVFCNTQALIWKREVGGETFESPLRTTGTVRAEINGQHFVFRFSFKGNNENHLAVLMQLLQTFRLTGDQLHNEQSRQAS